MRHIFCSNSSPWSLQIIIFNIILILKPFKLIQWFILSVSSMTLTTYFNVLFFTNITINITEGLKYLILLIIFENITSYCLLKQSLAKKIFVLDFLQHFQTKLNQRILSTDWIRIKLSDQEEIRRKIEEACSSIQYLVEELIDEIREISKFIMTVITIVYICPAAAILLAVVYISFYKLYLNKKSNELLDVKLKIIEKHDKLCSKYSRSNANMFEYVIHHEKDKIINITNELKVDMERQWFLLDYLYQKLSFQEDILGKSCTFLTIIMYFYLNGTNIFIIPLYHHLSNLTETIHSILVSYIRWLRLKKDYDLVKPILEEYDERISVDQINLNSELHIQDLSFQYEGKREAFHLQCYDSLTFKMGQVILVTGRSGAGKTD